MMKKPGGGSALLQKRLQKGVGVCNFSYIYMYMSCVMRKPAFSIGENKEADQLCGYADQRLCFHYLDCTIPLHPTSQISSLKSSSVSVQPGLCLTYSETTEIRFKLYSRRYSLQGLKNPGIKP